MKKQLAVALAASCAVAAPAFAWEPTKPIEIIVPFSAGGASDQMARVMQGAIQKNQLSKQPVVVINKPAAAGGEAMVDIQKSKGDAHKLLTTSSGIFMTPMTTKLPVSWTDYTPIAMMAQDAFGLWVKADSPYKSAKDFIAAAKTASPPLKVGGTAAKREDQLIVVGIERETGVKFAYVPHTGGGAASTQLAGGHLEATTNNPAEDVANWKGGATRPLCVFSEKALPYKEKVAENKSWSEIPTCPSEGINVTYQMLRGMFMPGGVTPEQQAYYVDLFKKVSETAEWKEYLARNALVPDFREGKAYVDFLKTDEERHRDLLTKAGFIAGN